MREVVRKIPKVHHEKLVLELTEETLEEFIAYLRYVQRILSTREVSDE